MIINHHREKLINAIIYFVKNTKRCGLTKLLKLLYFLDFIHFRETGRSVTGNSYFAWARGPVPADLWNEIHKSPGDDLQKAVLIIPPNKTEDEWQMQFKPKQKFNNSFFTKREMRIMEELAEIFLEAQANDMIEATHLKGQPWDVTFKKKGEKSEIDYRLALDGSDEKELSKEELEIRLQEMDEVKRVLG